MPVPSVATSISFHPSSSYVFSPSLSHLAEPRVTTTTNELVSLSLPPSLAIVDMATLNSLDAHSCRSACMDCRNVQTLPSQENLSVTLDPVIPASNLSSSTSYEFKENVLREDGKLQSVPSVESGYRTIDYQCITDVDIKQTLKSSSSPVKAPVCGSLSQTESLSCVEPLPRSLITVHEIGYRMSKKTGTRCAYNKENWEKEDNISELESLSIQSDIFHENKSKSLLSVNSAQGLHSSNEDRLHEEILSVPCQRGNRNEFYFDKTVSSGKRMYISSDLKLSSAKNSIQQPCTEEGTKAKSEHLFKPQKITVLSSSCSSDQTEDKCTSQLTDLTAESLQSLIGSCSSYERMLSVYNHCKVNGNNSSFVLIKSPSLQLINSNNIAEIFTPEMYIYDFSVNRNAVIKTGDFQLLEMREKKLEELFTLVLMEVPVLFDQTITFDLSEMLLECSCKDLVIQKRAFFDINFPYLNRIKVSAVQNIWNLNDESYAFKKNLSADEVFIRVNSDNFSLKQSTQWNPMHKKESLLGQGCLSCWMIRLHERFMVHKVSFGKNQPDSNPIYLGFLVSSDFLHSLNISTSLKGSLSISLSSSRPNHKYSTCTSVDVQFNGNNEDSVPLIPLGLYLPNGVTDTDSKWLISFTNSSQKDSQNLEDIFLTKRDVRTRNANTNVHLKNHFGLGAVNFEKKSKDCHISKLDAQNNETNEGNVHNNILFPKLQLLGKGKSEFLVPLVSIARGNKDIIEDASFSNKIFQCHSLNSTFRALNDDLQKNPSESPKDLVSETKQIAEMDCTNVPFSSPAKGEFTRILDCTDRSKDLLPPSFNQIRKSEELLCAKSQQALKNQNMFLKNDIIEMVNEESLQTIKHSTEKENDFSLVGYENGKFLDEVQKRTKKSQVGLDILDTSYHSFKKKFQAKRLEGYCKPFKVSKVSKSKLGVELKRLKRYPDDEVGNAKDDLNRKLGSSWKLDRYGNNCLSSLRNFITYTMLDSNRKIFENNMNETNDRNSVMGHHINYKMGSVVTPPLPNNYEKLGAYESGRQIVKHKSSDKKTNWNFLLPSSSSTKRSKLTLLIFCLAITSLLISLHALSTDSSLYIKPTFFLVQEDDAPTSSENPYIEAPHYFSQIEWERFSGDVSKSSQINSFQEITDDNEKMKAQHQMGNGVSYIKNLEISTKLSPENGIEMSSERIIVGDSENSPSENDKTLENEQFKRLTKTLSNVLEVNEDVKQNPNFLKSSSNFLSAMNFSAKKEELSPSTDGKSSHDENVLSWIKNKFRIISDINGKNKIDLDPKYSGTEIMDPKNEENIYQSYKPNKAKAFDLSNSENQTKPSVQSSEGTTNSQNEFDLNLAFIEKNELNAAYGIDGGTTGADVNIEDYTGDEDMGVLATSGNRLKFPKATRRLPQALIIGVRKGGTRALLEMLHLHPLIQKAAGEAHFFDRDENYAKGLQWYRRRMPPSLKGQITVEKSPSYFVTPEVPERVRAMNASIRLLLIVREPVTRAISDFAQLRSHSLAAKANATSRTKLDGGAEEDYGKKPTRSLSSFESLAILPDGRVDMSWRPISVSLYHRHIAAWLEAFPRDQILIVDGDQLASNPAPVLASVEKFLKLRPALTPTHFYFNATKGFYCLRSLPPGQQVDGMAMLPLSMNQPSSLPEGKCLRESKGRRHPRVDPSVVHKLRRFFAEHNRRFYEMVGEDFGWPEE